MKRRWGTAGQWVVRSFIHIRQIIRRDGETFQFGAFDASATLRKQKQTGVGDANDLTLDIPFHELTEHANRLIELGFTLHHSLHFNDAAVAICYPIHQRPAPRQIQQG